MKFGKDDEYIEVILRVPPEYEEVYLSYKESPDEDTLFEVYAVGSLPEPETPDFIDYTINFLENYASPAGPGRFA